MTNICFIPAGDISWASSRMRCWWPAECMADAIVTTWADVKAGNLPDARAYVFQKLVDVDLMKQLRERGALVIWDVCDPAWWFNPVGAQEASNAADCVVASCRNLADDFEKWSNRQAHVIPDRVLPEHFTRRGRHKDTTPVRLIWFGISPNRVALHAAAANLGRLRANKHEVTLTIFDNEPHLAMPELEQFLPVYYTRWALEREAETLAAHDIALLPPYPGPWGRIKSNNRILTAWAAGLPVTSGVVYEVLVALAVNPDFRQEEADSGREKLENDGDVRWSAVDWEALVDDLSCRR